MNILITGRLASITDAVCEELSERHKVVFASNDVQPAQLSKKINRFKSSPCDEDFEKIFHSYHFHTVIFFGEAVYDGNSYSGEYADLERCLLLCSAHDIHNVLYLRPSVRSASGAGRPDSEVGVLYAAIDMLCSYYRNQRGLSVMTVDTPVLYGYGEFSSVIGDAIAQAKSTAAVRFAGQEQQMLGYLSQKDLAELLLRVVESWQATCTHFSLKPASKLTYKELGEIIKTKYPTVRITYGSAAADIITDEGDNIAKSEYDWVPIRQVRDELPDLIVSQDDQPLREQGTRLQKAGAFLRKHHFVVQLIELLIGFVAMELLNRVTSTTILFSYIDFRLLYIVLLGTIHGLKTGLGAAALASISLLAASIVNTNNWAATIYDAQTWLPYVFYFLIGAVTGYIRDRRKIDYESLSGEKAVLEDKYILLNEFYVSAVQSKEQYKNQIMSYRDSFGRLFDIARSLDSNMVDQVFNEALNALEGILENKSVCLYRCDDSMQFARLIVCSREIAQTTDKSLNLSVYSRMVEEFRDGEVWVNRERLDGYPEYAVPLYRDGKVVALISIRRCSYEQMAVYYENMIKVVCGLIKISLIRAIEYTEKTENEIYLPGSPIIEASHFSKLIQVKEEMANNGTAEYVLLRFDVPADKMIAVAKKIQTFVRSTDFLGQGPDGGLYLCLSQSNEKNIHVVLSRIKNSGFSFHEMGSGE